MRYVVGFLFDQSCTSVVLLVKNRPTWQAGFLNGVGGKANEGEILEEAMRRESIEEVGVTPTEWKYVSSLENPLDSVTFYAARDQWAFDRAKQRTDEEVVRSLVQNIQTCKTVPCLKFLIPWSVYALNNAEHYIESWQLV